MASISKGMGNKLGMGYQKRGLREYTLKQGRDQVEEEGKIRELRVEGEDTYY
jgi:hypothetical protein